MNKKYYDKNNYSYRNTISMPKMVGILSFLIIILGLLIIRVFYLQLIDGNRLKELATKQQITDEIITPTRGTIYDSTGQVLAISSSVDTITINPKLISVKNKDEETTALKQKVTEALSSIFELDYNEIYQKVNSNSSIETIAKKVEQDKVDQLKAWMEENKIYSGINIDEDSKRTYPYSTLASHVIGFCGTDNDGRTGVEYKWESILAGTSGKHTSAKDALDSEIANSEETLIEAENGNDIVLTIDVKIQTIVEKYLKEAVDQNNCSEGGNVIVMNPKTGDILAMATYPSYDLNTPSSPNSDELSQIWSSLSASEKSTALGEIWRSKSVADTYEPGSVFKVITAAIALEENITDIDIEDDFYCPGYEIINGQKIHCWRVQPHLHQNLTEALGNSCNPAFMQLNFRIVDSIGVSGLYKYYNAFGFFEKTNAGLYGETLGLFHNESIVKNFEIATMSFGQRFTITPLQMITAISALANDGTLMQPRIVKEIINTDTGNITYIDPVEVRQVVSEETAAKALEMMEYVATIGTGKTAAVSGYTIGGKTGTSEPNSNEGSVYVASYCAVAPIDEAEVTLLLTLYGPPKGNHNGGQIAGPVVSNMLSEILPYLSVKPNN